MKKPRYHFLISTKQTKTNQAMSTSEFFPESTRNKVIELNTCSVKSVHEDWCPYTLMQPPYQRGITWTETKVDKFINTIMRDEYVPPVLLYKYPEALGDIEFESIDGQHRLESIKAFREAAPMINKKGKEIPAYVKSGDIYMFYKETEYTRNWETETGNSVKYLDERQQKKFDKFRLSIQVYNSELTIDERRRIFANLQEGVPVRNSDKLKNTVDGKLVSELNEIDWESPYKEHYMSLLTSCREQNRLFCMVRLRMIFKNLDQTDEYCRMIDANIKKGIENGRFEAQGNIHEFDDVMTKVYRALVQLKGIHPGAKYTPIQVFVLVLEIFKSPDPENIDRLVERCATYVNSGLKTLPNRDVKDNKTYKTLWFDGSFSIDGAIDYLNMCRKYLSSSEPPMPMPPAKRKYNKNTTKKAVWNKRFCGETNGNCFCCDKILKIDGVNWDRGHDLAHSKCGSDTDINNLEVICKKCNSEQGTRSIDKYMRDIELAKGINN
jgi:hypothetical protein